MRVFSQLKSLLRQCLRRKAKYVHNDESGTAFVDGIGHRDYVGGYWDAIGSVQLRFLIDHGLKPHHVFLDVGCGSLRAGVKLIPYLETAHYLGIDSKQEAIDAGIKIELQEELYRSKRPEFVTSEAFEFSRFSKRPDFAMAQAVLFLLTDDQILLCLRNLRLWSKPTTKFYATYSQGSRPEKMVVDYHPYVFFIHTRDQMIGFGERTGWKSRYIGDWGHPRGQMIVEYSAS